MRSTDSGTSPPNASLLKLRQFGEAVAQHVAAVHGIPVGAEHKQADLLSDFRRRQILDDDVLSLLHLLRVQGNAGVHQLQVASRQAADALRIARQVAIWFHRAFRSPGPGFKPGPFVAPTTLTYGDTAQRQADEMARLQGDLTRAREEASAERERLQRAVEQQPSELRVWEQLAQDEEAERKRLQAEAAGNASRAQSRRGRRRRTGRSTPAARQQREAAQATQQAIALATRAIDLDEAETRALIDRQLRDAGLEADSTALRHGRGTRPERDRCMAVAE